MNKEIQVQRLIEMMDNSELQSGLCLINTDLSDPEIEALIKNMESWLYIKETLIPALDGDPFELFVIGLSSKCEDVGINRLREQLLFANIKNKETIIYSLLIQSIKHHCRSCKSVIHVQGIIDLSALQIEDLCKLEAAVDKHNERVLIINKYKNTCEINDYLIPKYRNFKVTNRNIGMRSRVNKVYISYKHDDNYRGAIEAIKQGLNNSGIQLSIDETDIGYRENIVEYEEEIGQADKVIMFVTPSYIKSLDCMYEMAQLFSNENIDTRVFPLVDLGPIKRNSDGLYEIKIFWQNEKARRADKIKCEFGHSTYNLTDLNKIESIINSLDIFWDYIVHVNTGNYNDLIENNAAKLVAELHKSFTCGQDTTIGEFLPSEDVRPAIHRVINQYGEKSIHIENNSGNITIN